jgi:hypothetical protein
MVRVELCFLIALYIDFRGRHDEMKTRGTFEFRKEGEVMENIVVAMHQV